MSSAELPESVSTAELSPAAPAPAERLSVEAVVKLQRACRSAGADFVETLLATHDIPVEAESKVRSILLSLGNGNQVALNANWAELKQDDVTYVARLLSSTLFANELLGKEKAEERA